MTNSLTHKYNIHIRMLNLLLMNIHNVRIFLALELLYARIKKIHL